MEHDHLENTSLLVFFIIISVRLTDAFLQAVMAETIYAIARDEEMTTHLKVFCSLFPYACMTVVLT